MVKNQKRFVRLAFKSLPLHHYVCNLLLVSGDKLGYMLGMLFMALSCLLPGVSNDDKSREPLECP